MNPNHSAPSARRLRWVLLALAALLVAGLGTAGWVCFKWLPEKPAALRVGIKPWPGYEFLYRAQEKGWYREAGLEVRLVEFSSLSGSRRAYERGQINVLASTVIEVLQIRENSARSPQIVLVVDYSNGGDVTLGRPGLTNATGLRGTRIGLELASLGG